MALSLPAAASGPHFCHLGIFEPDLPSGLDWELQARARRLPLLLLWAPPRLSAPAGRQSSPALAPVGEPT